MLGTAVTNGELKTGEKWVVVDKTRTKEDAEKTEVITSNAGAASAKYNKEELANTLRDDKQLKKKLSYAETYRQNETSLGLRKAGTIAMSDKSHARDVLHKAQYLELTLADSGTLNVLQGNLKAEHSQKGIVGGISLI